MKNEKKSLRDFFVNLMKHGGEPILDPTKFYMYSKEQLQEAI